MRSGYNRRKYNSNTEFLHRRLLLDFGSHFLRQVKIHIFVELVLYLRILIEIFKSDAVFLKNVRKLTAFCKIASIRFTNAILGNSIVTWATTNAECTTYPALYSQ